MEEIWKDIAGYENIYEVSSFGRVRTSKNKVTHTERHGERKWKQRYLKDKTPNGRDVRVSLWKDGESKDYLVHRLVAQAFIPIVYGQHDINHVDGNPKNNRVENLEWCNHLQNNNHAFDNNLIATGTRIKLSHYSGVKKEFRSLTRASEYLGRNHGYVSRKLRENGIIKSCSGEVYTIELL